MTEAEELWRGSKRELWMGMRRRTGMGDDQQSLYTQENVMAMLLFSY